MPYPSDFLDELKARVSLESVIGRKVKLTKRGREFVALCPFHNEKTPSFTVVEEKGFYHCFGCGAHGDAIRFLMDNEGLPFHEAVEKLAAEAGLPLPEFSKEDLEKEKKRTSLYEVMEKAANWFISRLHAEEGARARKYLEGRGLSEQTVRRFSLGFAPDRRSALKEAFTAWKIKEDDLIACGLLIKPEDGKDTFDRFRNRVMFPIQDARGRTVGFGGRTLGDDRAKYMNSPETALFHKGRLLYNHPGARKAAREQGGVIVVEGYTDVIALAEAGIDNVVAPLGTALTEDQLYHLWRMAGEPVLCFDGDDAGYNASVRALERALPILRPGQSLKFVWLPSSDDPDSLVRREGPESFRAMAEKATPLVDLLWRRLTEKTPIGTPEQRAGLEKKVFEALAPIRNEKLKSHYRSEFGKRLYALFRGGARRKPLRKGARPLRERFGASLAPERSQNLLKTRIGRAKGDEPVGTFLEELILYTVINHPKLAGDHFEDLSKAPIRGEDLHRLRNEILDYAHEGGEADAAQLKEHLLKKGMEGPYMRLAGQGALKNIRFARAGAEYELAEKWWLKTLERLTQYSSLKREFEEVEKDYLENPSERKWQQLIAIKTEINRNILNEDFLRDYDLDSASGSFI